MSESNFAFELITQDEKARLGKITTSKGIIETPAFMPVGTQGTVKGIFPEDLKKSLHNSQPKMIFPKSQPPIIPGNKRGIAIRTSLSIVIPQALKKLKRKTSRWYPVNTLSL